MPQWGHHHLPSTEYKEPCLIGNRQAQNGDNNDKQSVLCGIVCLSQSWWRQSVGRLFLLNMGMGTLPKKISPQKENDLFTVARHPCWWTAIRKDTICVVKNRLLVLLAGNVEDDKFNNKGLQKLHFPKYCKDLFLWHLNPPYVIYLTEDAFCSNFCKKQKREWKRANCYYSLCSLKIILEMKNFFFV